MWPHGYLIWQHSILLQDVLMQFTKSWVRFRFLQELSDLAQSGSGGGRDGCGVTGRMAVRPVTATPLDIFEETSEQFPAVFVVTNVVSQATTWSCTNPNQGVSTEYVKSFWWFAETYILNIYSGD